MARTFDGTEPEYLRGPDGYDVLLQPGDLIPYPDYVPVGVATKPVPDDDTTDPAPAPSTKEKTK